MDVLDQSNESVEVKRRGCPPGGWKKPLADTEPIDDEREKCEEQAIRKIRKFDKEKYRQIEQFGSLDIDAETMARILDVPVKYVERSLANPKSKMRKHYLKGQAKGVVQIEARIRNVAMGVEKGNPLLLTYLSKQKKGNQQQQKEHDASGESILQNISARDKTHLAELLDVRPGKEKEINDE